MKKVLIAMDEGPLADEISAFGFRLAKQLDAEVALLSVIEAASVYGPDSGVPLDRVVTQRRLELKDFMEHQARAHGCSHCWKFVEQGKASEQILNIVRQWRPDLVVLGSHGRKGIGRAFLGSVSEEVVRNVAVPTVIVPLRYVERLSSSESEQEPEGRKIRC